MGRRCILFAALVLLVATGTARAGRLGGAYRGPPPESYLDPHALRRDPVDFRKFWMYRFEHQKESILADRLVALRKRAKRPSAAVVEKTLLPVLHKSMTHPSPWVRDAAALALGKIGAKASVPYLMGRLDDPDEAVAEDALLALGLQGDPKAVSDLTKRLTAKYRRKNVFAALALSLTRDPAALEPLLDAWRAVLEKEPVDERLASCIAVALGAVCGVKQVKEIAAPLSRKRLHTLKVHVCQALGRIGGKDSRDALLKALRRADNDFRAGPVLAAGRFEDREVGIRLLGKEGTRNGSDDVRCAALTSLARMAAKREPGDALRKRVLQTLWDHATCPQKNLYTGMHAALSEGEFGYRKSVPYYLEYLSPRLRTKYRPENHSAMAMALGLLREPKGAVLLSRILAKREIDPDYRGYCAFALGLLGERANSVLIRLALQEEPNEFDVVRSCCWSLALIGGKNDLPVLFAVLKSNRQGSHHARGAAAIAIGLLGDDETLTQLLKIVETDETSSNRAFAIAAIGWLCDRDAVPRLPRLFEGLYHREAAEPIRAAWSNL